MTDIITKIREHLDRRCLHEARSPQHAMNAVLKKHGMHDIGLDPDFVVNAMAEQHNVPPEHVPVILDYALHHAKGKGYDDVRRLKTYMKNGQPEQRTIDDVTRQHVHDVDGAVQALEPFLKLHQHPKQDQAIVHARYEQDNEAARHPTFSVRKSQYEKNEKDAADAKHALQHFNLTNPKTFHVAFPNNSYRDTIVRAAQHV